MAKNPVAVKGAACTTGHDCDTVTTVLGGSPDVLVGGVNGIGVLRVGDPLAVHTIGNPAFPPIPPPCQDHPGQVVNTGSATVIVNKRGIARVGDSVDIAGAITAGITNVVAGG
tara:strand:- start:322 stop:660 length:339 start_codon:yes stop_codon:yes gene_type:complete